ncbi:16S rRNA (guanine(966)-N(2))-methyltransferase RsmD [Levilactobacillus bambusae]|uniref:16S rRNA (Guanine(966)-N(2))-methyltransferase RsmD n=1 Tax=Levilactobacillus bambusae TaxID=2024736 RepID=A0A2V1N0C9_9LACO|nr:16S rRNA (guanine(966)-N(2))-methyltransferase RsmD [Levilactobacillus bambusae]PWG00674.1 16S rRNA (guanine(966)-N(2))-methyltransferase RsmD [Levilactobacillus bambusae]
MRVISGEYGGRKLKAVPGMKTRPTTDKVKENMFNIVGPYFDGGQSLDLFSGSGGLSIEAVSRGIDHAVLIDRQRAAIATIQDNIAVTKDPDRFTVIKGDAERVLDSLSQANDRFDLVFFDPPYKDQKIMTEMERLIELKLLAPNAVVVCETDMAANLPDDLPNYRLLKRKDYGITQLTIYQLGGE